MGIWCWGVAVSPPPSPPPTPWIWSMHPLLPYPSADQLQRPPCLLEFFRTSRQAPLAMAQRLRSLGDKLLVLAKQQSLSTSLAPQASSSLAPRLRARPSPWGCLLLGTAAGGLSMLAPFPTAHCAPFVSTAADNIRTATQGIDLTGAGMTATPKQRYQIVFVLGGPGSGKGTQCAKLVNTFGLVHLSAGDLLRAHMKSGTSDGNMVAETIKQGQIVPSRVTVSLLEDAMAKSGKTKFLIDGFPRNEENRGAFEAQTGLVPEFVLFFDCPEAVMEQRLLGRQEGRTDDNIETIRKRFKVFLESTLPIIDHYGKAGRVRKVDADRSPDAVFQDVEPLFDFARQEATV